MKELAEQFLISKIGTNFHDYLFQEIRSLEVYQVSTNGHLIQIDFTCLYNWDGDNRPSQSYVQVSCWEIMEYLFWELQSKK